MESRPYKPKTHTQRRRVGTPRPYGLCGSGEI